MIEAYSPDLKTRVENIPNFLSLDATRSWHATDPATFSLPYNHRAVPYLDVGTPVRVMYRKGVFMSGRIEKVTTPLFIGASTPSVSFEAQSWWQLLDYTLGYPNPLGQTQQNSWWSQMGKSETVVKNYVQLNLEQRAQHPISIIVSEGRGPNTSITSRWQPLSERALATMDASGLVFTLEHMTAAEGFDQSYYRPLIFDCHWGVVHPLKLNRLNVVAGGTYTVSAPTATSVLAGGRGQGTTRMYRTATITDAHPLWKREGYVDASDIKDDAQADPVVTPAQADQMTQDKADEELSKLGPKSSLDVTLRDWDSWSYRRPYEVGDRVSVDVNGLTVTDRIESVRLTVSASNGVQVVSSIGGWEDDATYELARALRATQAELRRLGSQT